MTSALPPLVHILLVEDNELVGELMSRRLSRFAPRLRWAKTGPEALAMLAQELPQVIFLDQLLPGCNGSEVLRQLRPSAPLLPVMGLTASTMGDEIADLEAAGATVAVEKPLSLGDLRMFLSEHFTLAE